MVFLCTRFILSMKEISDLTGTEAPPEPTSDHAIVPKVVEGPVTSFDSVLPENVKNDSIRIPEAYETLTPAALEERVLRGMINFINLKRKSKTGDLILTAVDELRSRVELDNLAESTLKVDELSGRVEVTRLPSSSDSNTRKKTVRELIVPNMDNKDEYRIWHEAQEKYYKKILGDRNYKVFVLPHQGHLGGSIIGQYGKQSNIIRRIYVSFNDVGHEIGPRLIREMIKDFQAHDQAKNQPVKDIYFYLILGHPYTTHLRKAFQDEGFLSMGVFLQPEEYDWVSMKVGTFEELLPVEPLIWYARDDHREIVKKAIEEKNRNVLHGSSPASTAHIAQTSSQEPRLIDLLRTKVATYVKKITGYFPGIFGNPDD